MAIVFNPPTIGPNLEKLVSPPNTKNLRPNWMSDLLLTGWVRHLVRALPP